MTYTLTLPDINPKMLVSANRRIHHHERARVVRYWRELARDSVPEDWLELERAHITFTFRWPTRTRRDVCNFYSYVVKSAVDGLVDAGLLADDDDTHLIGPDMRRDPEKGPHAVTITIQEIP